MHYAHKKTIWGCEIATFRTKNSPFPPDYSFKLAGYNWLEGGPGPLVFHIVVSYCCTRKMLKRNWRNNKLFWHIFVIGEILIEGGGVSWSPSPPPCLRLCSNWGKKSVCKFFAMFLAFSNKISTVQKIVQSSSWGQGNFQGLEASRPRTWLSRPRPRTSKCVLEDFTSARQ